jgi:hypothetical protein
MYYVILYNGQLYSTNVIVCTVAIAPDKYNIFLLQIIYSPYTNIIHIIYFLKLKLLPNDKYVLVRYLNMWSFEVNSNISTNEV